MKFFKDIGRQLNLGLHELKRSDIIAIDQLLASKQLPSDRAHLIKKKQLIVNAYTLKYAAEEALYDAKAHEGHDRLKWSNAYKQAQTADAGMLKLLSFQLTEILNPDMNLLKWENLYSLQFKACFVFLVINSILKQINPLSELTILEENSTLFLLLLILPTPIVRLISTRSDLIPALFMVRMVDDVFNASPYFDMDICEIGKHGLDSNSLISNILSSVNNDEELEQLKSQEQPPEAYYCGILLTVMSDPVALTTYHSPIRYERTAIQAWLKNRKVDPATNMAASSKDLVRDYTLKLEIDRYVAKKLALADISTYKNNADVIKTPAEAHAQSGTAHPEKAYRLH